MLTNNLLNILKRQIERQLSLYKIILVTNLKKLKSKYFEIYITSVTSDYKFFVNISICLDRVFEMRKKIMFF